MKRGICTYCGETGALTSDHPIPRNLFPKPRPDLITVPSCQDCNNGFSLNDEYLRLVLVSRHDTFKHPDAQGVWGAAMRGLSRPDQLGLAKRFLSRAREVNVSTAAGLHLGRAGVFEPDISRIEAVAVRAVKGLFFNEYGRRIPDEYDYKTYILDLVVPQWEGAPLLTEMVRKLVSRQPTVIGNRTCAFWHQIVEGHDCASVWLIEFYGHMHCLVLTGPQEGSPSRSSEESSEGGRELASRPTRRAASIVRCERYRDRGRGPRGGAILKHCCDRRDEAGHPLVLRSLLLRGSKTLHPVAGVLDLTPGPGGAGSLGLTSDRRSVGDGAAEQPLHLMNPPQLPRRRKPEQHPQLVRAVHRPQLPRVHPSVVPREHHCLVKHGAPHLDDQARPGPRGEPPKPAGAPAAPATSGIRPAATALALRGGS